MRRGGLGLVSTISPYPTPASVITAIYNACRNVTESPPSTRYPVMLTAIKITNRINANSSRFRRAIVSPSPFVDQVGYQSAPPGLMTRTQAHSAVAVVVLIE